MTSTYPGGLPRPHTGRRRNDAAREAILDATFDLLRTHDIDSLTIDEIAASARVGRQTIYRWWPSKAAVMADAMVYRARGIVPLRDTGSFAADLTDFLTDTFGGLADPGLARALRQLVAVAQHDGHVAGVLAHFTAQRRAALRTVLERGRDRGQLSGQADLAMLVDMAYGVLYYRLLVGHAPLDRAAARILATHLIAAGGGQTSLLPGAQAAGSPADRRSAATVGACGSSSPGAASTT